MSLTAEDIVRLFEEDVRARKRLAELLVSEPDVRLALANAILREVTTKEDIRELRKELRDEMYRIREELKVYIDARIGGVEGRVNSLEQRINDLAALVRASLVAIVITLASTVLTPLILKLLGVL